MAKAFLSTGNAIYRKNFDEILAIRNGLVPRTEAYEPTYWEYLFALNPHMGIYGVQAPLITLMERNGFTPAELSKLRQAMAISDELVEIEIGAMVHVEKNRASQTDRLVAHDKLASDEFLTLKQEMLRLITQAQSMADSRYESAISQAHSLAEILRLSFVIITVSVTALGLKGWLSERSNSRRLEISSNKDPLTEIANRSFLQAHLESATRKAAAGHDAVVLGMIDLNNFKEINDRLGHLRGDEVLRMVGSRLHSHCREGDVVARYGGDEFVIVFVSPAEHQENAITRMREILVSAFQSPLSGSFGSIHLGASMGISVFPTHAGSIEELLTTADEAMYVAKSEKSHIRVAEFSGG